MLAPIWGRKFRFSRNDSVVPVLSRFHRHPYFTSERCPTAEVCSPPVGGGDLVHQFQPCAVAGPAVCFQLTGRIVLQWDAFRRATLYENDNFFALGPGTQTDGAAGRIVPHTVGEQVVYRPAEQERVSINLGQGFRRKIHLEIKPIPQAAIEEIGGDLTEKSLHL